MNALSDLIGEREAMSIRSRSLSYNYLTINAAAASLLQVLMVGVFPWRSWGWDLCGLRRRRMQHARSKRFLILLACWRRPARRPIALNWQQRQEQIQTSGEAVLRSTLTA